MSDASRSAGCSRGRVIGELRSALDLFGQLIAWPWSSPERTNRTPSRAAANLSGQSRVAKRPFDRLLSRRRISRDLGVQRPGESRFGHRRATRDQRVELLPSHRLAFPLALQQPQPLLGEQQAGRIGVDMEILVRAGRLARPNWAIARQVAARPQRPYGLAGPHGNAAAPARYFTGSRGVAATITRSILCHSDTPAWAHDAQRRSVSCSK